MGLTHLAITDHDTTAGVREGCRILSEFMPKLICGIELSCSGAPGKCHMLGLGIDPGNVTLCGTLERVQSAAINSSFYHIPTLAVFSVDQLFNVGKSFNRALLFCVHLLPPLYAHTICQAVGIVNA
jgi:hypothetical protein